MGDSERIAALAQVTFWLVLPTVAFFLALPVLLRQGLAFWPSMAVACPVTVALYLLSGCCRNWALAFSNQGLLATRA
jgi:hypothetical protein